MVLVVIHHLKHVDEHDVGYIVATTVLMIMKPAVPLLAAAAAECIANNVTKLRTVRCDVMFDVVCA